MAWWLMPRTLDPEVGGSSPTRVKPCCVLEQGTFTPRKVLVIPRKRWLCPNLTEKIVYRDVKNQSTNQPISVRPYMLMGCYHVKPKPSIIYYTLVTLFDYGNRSKSILRKC